MSFIPTKIQLGLFLLVLFNGSGLAQESLSPSLKLNATEQDFLSKTNFLALCTDPDWLPYEAINSEDQHEGIMADFHNMWSERIGVEIRLVKTASWQQSLDYIKQRKCDLLSSAQDIPARRNYLSVTQSIISYPFAIATKKDSEFIVNMRQVLNKDFAMVKGYAAIDILRSKYPTINIRVVDSVKAGLKMVERGEVYGFIDTVPTIAYQSQVYGISHINISGVLELNYNMSVGVRSDQPELLSIMNKVIAETSTADRQKILNNWLSVHYVTDLNYKLIWQILAVIAVVMVFVLYRYIIGSKLNRKLQLQSRYDHLTGVANRYLLDSTFHTEKIRAERYDLTFSIMIIDIDWFKSINDNYGHNIGDQVLIDLAALLSFESRENDIVGRWGGEEFLIICPETPKAGAQQLAEHIRKKAQAHNFNINQPVCISIGVTEFKLKEPMNRCIKRADDALYSAKEGGRNKVVSL